MMSTVIGGAMLPHAPQFFTMPDTEDKALVAHVREVAADIGERAAGAQARPVDHLLQRPRRAVLPQCGAAVHGPCRRRGERRVRRPQVPLEGAERDQLRAGAPALPAEFRPGLHQSTAKIDYAIGIPLTHLGHTGPVLPIYVNAYLPPQPTMERCYAFGQAVARTVTAHGAEDRHPVERRHVAFPRHRPLFQSGARLGPARAGASSPAGNLKSLIGYDETELDDTGNIELRCWACAAGALGERKPDVVSMDPSWHHNYASLAWIGSRPAEHAAHYPSIKPELVELTAALHGLAHDADKRAQYVADAGAYADKFRLPPDQREALVKLDMPTIVKMGAHPLVPFLAQMQIQRLRR